MTKGIDISKYQSDVSSYMSSTDFVIFRLGYGKSTIDTKFWTHYKNCVETSGKGWGGYWFCYALSVEQARNEAKSCIQLLKQCKIKPTYPIYYDLEGDSQRYFRDNKGRDMTKDEVLEFTKAFCDELEKAGYYAGFYCNKDYMKRYYSGLTRYTVWLADYTKAGQTFDNTVSHIHMKQYTSKPLDMDVCRVDFPSIIKKNHLNGW